MVPCGARWAFVVVLLCVCVFVFILFLLLSLPFGLRLGRSLCVREREGMYSMSCTAAGMCMTIDASRPYVYNGGTEHVGFSPTRRTLLARAKRRGVCREVFGESHEG